MKERILHEADGFYVLDKPSGVLSQKDKSGDDDLAALLKKELEGSGAKVSFLAPVHRLDRNTSGLLILARSPEWARKLTDIIKEGKLEKTYLALVKGDPGQEGRYEFPLWKDEKKNQVFVREKGEAALTEFHRLQKMGSISLVEVRLHTGRPHQIRAHFAHTGHALLGDRKYGKKPWSELFARPALHAHRLGIPLETGMLQVESPLPGDMKDLMLRLGARL